MIVIQERLNIDQDIDSFHLFDLFDRYGEDFYTNIHGLPFKTPQELERHYYMLGDSRMASMWTIVDELEVALKVSSMLDE